MNEPRWRLVKLVRDEVHKFALPDATGVKYAPITDLELAKEKLADKLVEESIELVRELAAGRTPLHEAVDVYEALRAIIEMDGTDMLEVEGLADQKVEERGGFKGLTGMWLLGRARNVEGDQFEDQRVWEGSE